MLRKYGPTLVPKSRLPRESGGMLRLIGGFWTAQGAQVGPKVVGVVSLLSRFVSLCLAVSRFCIAFIAFISLGLALYRYGFVLSRLQRESGGVSLALSRFCFVLSCFVSLSYRCCLGWSRFVSVCLALVSLLSRFVLLCLAFVSLLSRFVAFTTCFWWSESRCFLAVVSLLSRFVAFTTCFWWFEGPFIRSNVASATCFWRFEGPKGPFWPRERWFCRVYVGPAAGG